MKHFKNTASVLAIMGIGIAQLSASVWIGGDNKPWMTAANWSDGAIPNAAGAVALFNDDYTAAHAAANILNNEVTVGTLVLGSAGTTKIVSVRTALSGTPTGALVFDNLGQGGSLSAYINNQSVGIGAGPSTATRPATAIHLKDDLNIERKGTGHLRMHVDLSITDGQSHAVRILDSSEAGGAVYFMEAYAGATNYSTLGDGNGKLSVFQESSKTELLLYGFNTYTGGTTISNGGIVRINDDTGLGDTASALVFEGTGGTLHIKDTVNSFSTSRAIILNGNGTLDFSTNAAASTRSIYSQISGDGTLTIKAASSAGSHAVKLFGNNTHTGGNVFDKARIEVSSNAILGALNSSVTLKNNAALIMGASSLVAGKVERDLILENGGGSLGFRASSGVWEWAGAISGNGTLTKYFDSNLIVSSNNNTYTGGTIISHGILYVNNTAGSGTGTGTVNVYAGAGFGGYGRAAGDVIMQAGSTLHVGYQGLGGFSIGSLALVKDTTELLTSVTIAFGNAVGTLAIDGTLDLGGYDITLDLSGYTGGSIDLLTFAALANGDLSNFSLTGVSASQYSLALGTDAKTLSLIAVPEPAAAGLLLGVSVLALCVARRRAR